MNKKILSFCVYFVVLTVLATWPQPFAWSNRISPEVLGLPFAIFWQFLIAALFSVGLITWYVLDARSGELKPDRKQRKGVHDDRYHDDHNFLRAFAVR
jgi:hypothetical protein